MLATNSKYKRKYFLCDNLLQYGVSFPVEMKYLKPGAWFGLTVFKPIMAHPVSFSLHEKHLPLNITKIKF